MERFRKIKKGDRPGEAKPKSDFDVLNDLYGIDQCELDDPQLPSKKLLKRPDPVVTEKTVNNVRYTVIKDDKRERKFAQNTTGNPVMIEVIANDRHGRKERIKCFPSDTVLMLKKLIAAKLGTRHEKLKLQRANAVLNDKISLEDYEIKNGSALEIYYN
jgi:ubiquitin-like protein 5